MGWGSRLKIERILGDWNILKCSNQHRDDWSSTGQHQLPTTPSDMYPAYWLLTAITKGSASIRYFNTFTIWCAGTIINRSKYQHPFLEETKPTSARPDITRAKEERAQSHLALASSVFQEYCSYAAILAAFSQCRLSKIARSSVVRIPSEATDRISKLLQLLHHARVLQHR